MRPVTISFASARARPMFNSPNIRAHGLNEMLRTVNSFVRWICFLDGPDSSGETLANVR